MTEKISVVEEEGIKRVVVSKPFVREYTLEMVEHRIKSLEDAITNLTKKLDRFKSLKAKLRE